MSRRRSCVGTKECKKWRTGWGWRHLGCVLAVYCVDAIVVCRKRLPDVLPREKQPRNAILHDASDLLRKKKIHHEHI